MSSDWVHFFRASLEQHLGGVAIEMAGSVGSVESPEVYNQPIGARRSSSSTRSIPAGCRTLFRVGSGTDAAGTEHVPVGYFGETRAFGETLAAPDHHGAADRRLPLLGIEHVLWGAAGDDLRPARQRTLRPRRVARRVRGEARLQRNCTKASPIAANGASAGQALRSSVAAFRIGDGEFISLPGEVFPFTFFRGFLGPQDMPDPGPALPPWLIPHMHAPFRFFDGLGEDMLGYIFPRGNAVGIPTRRTSTRPTTDRFGCGHSDDSEAASADTADIVGAGARARARHARAGPRRSSRGRYVLPDGTLSRDPLGGPVLKCTTETDVRRARVVPPAASAWPTADG